MTVQRRDEHSTEFGLWLRTRNELASSKGFIATNIDYVWKNYKTGEWMLIEEKRYRHTPERWQEDLFHFLDTVCKNDKKYKGFHLIVFEKTCPADGWINLDHKRITKEQLIKFLEFTDF